MRIYIDNRVYDELDRFYTISMQIHASLDYDTVVAKIDRLEKALTEFADYAEIFHKHPYRHDWDQLGYYEYSVEKFHFAYKVYQLPSGEKILYYHDVVHDTLNYNPNEAQ